MRGLRVHWIKENSDLVIHGLILLGGFILFVLIWLAVMNAFGLAIIRMFFG
jgi:hypothetical protein